MPPVCSIDLERLPEIRAALKKWLTEITKTFRLQEVYLYGSFARGKPHEGSDIDLILIGPFQGKLPYRILQILNTTELPVEPLCFRPEEWAHMLRSGNPLAQEVLRSGRRVRV